MEPASTLQFRPDRDLSSLPDFLPFCGSFTLSQTKREFTLHIEKKPPLTYQEIGRLIVVNGKFRTERIRLILICPEPLYRYLERLDLHRIIWMESDFPS